MVTEIVDFYLRVRLRPDHRLHVPIEPNQLRGHIHHHGSLLESDVVVHQQFFQPGGRPRHELWLCEDQEAALILQMLPDDPERGVRVSLLRRSEDENIAVTRDGGLLLEVYRAYREIRAFEQFGQLAKVRVLELLRMALPVADGEVEGYFIVGRDGKDRVQECSLTDEFRWGTTHLHHLHHPRVHLLELDHFLGRHLLHVALSVQQGEGKCLAIELDIQLLTEEQNLLPLFLSVHQLVQTDVGCVPMELVQRIFHMLNDQALGRREDEGGLHGPINLRQLLDAALTEGVELLLGLVEAVVVTV